MKRILTIIMVCAAFVSIGKGARAERLEVGLAFTPTFLQDERYEAFSDTNLNTLRMGADVRVLAISLGRFNLIPFISYRFSEDGGEPYYVLDTNLKSHDFAAGLRVQRDLTSWLGVFAEASGGLLLSDMKGSLIDGHSDYYYGSLENRGDYSDRQTTWMVQGQGGVEFHISKIWLASRGVSNFGFGIEIGFGYTGRGDLNFKPKLETVADNEIETKTNPWGHVNTSGFTTQIAASFKFF